MSRTFWVAVGATGGIIAYRRGNAAVERAKERTKTENLRAAARAVSTGARRTAHVAAFVAGERRDPRVVEASVQRISVEQAPLRTVPSGARVMSPAADRVVVDLREPKEKATGRSGRGRRAAG